MAETPREYVLLPRPIGERAGEKGNKDALGRDNVNLLRYHLPVLALLVASGHTGVPVPRTGPEPSDIALFLVAALTLWFVRRAMRRRTGTPSGDAVRRD